MWRPLGFEKCTHIRARSRTHTHVRKRAPGKGTEWTTARSAPSLILYRRMLSYQFVTVFFLVWLLISFLQCCRFVACLLLSIFFPPQLRCAISHRSCYIEYIRCILNVQLFLVLVTLRSVHVYVCVCLFDCPILLDCLLPDAGAPNARFTCPI